MHPRKYGYLRPCVYEKSQCRWLTRLSLPPVFCVYKLFIPFEMFDVPLRSMMSSHKPTHTSPIGLLQFLHSSSVSLVA